MGLGRGTILLVDESGELASRLSGALPGRPIVKCARTGSDVLSVITSLRFDVIVLHHPSPDALETHLLPTLSKLADPPRLIVVSDQRWTSAIAARFGFTCLKEPTTADEIVAAIDLVCDRDLRVDRP
jgi:DNA-binding response OmpR family regulator